MTLDPPLALTGERFLKESGEYDEYDFWQVLAKFFYALNIKFIEADNFRQLKTKGENRHFILTFIKLDVSLHNLQIGCCHRSHNVDCICSGYPGV